MSFLLVLTCVPGESTGTMTSSGATQVNMNQPASNVTPAPLTLTAMAESQTYGTVLNAFPSLDSKLVTYSGLKNSDALSSITLDYGSYNGKSPVAGTYTGQITPGTPVFTNSAMAANYTLNPQAAATLTVTAVPLTLTAMAEQPVKHTHWYK